MLPPNLARALAKGTVMSCFFFFFFFFIHLFLFYCIKSKHAEYSCCELFHKPLLGESRTLFTHTRMSGGGSRIIFLTECAARGLNPYPYLRIFLTQKRLKRQFSQRGFCLKNGWFYNFVANFVKWDPPLRIFFWPKGDPCLRIFGEKVTHLDGISPYALICEYPPAYVI